MTKTLYEQFNITVMIKFFWLENPFKKWFIYIRNNKLPENEISYL